MRKATVNASTMQKKQTREIKRGGMITLPLSRWQAAIAFVQDWEV